LGGFAVPFLDDLQDFLRFHFVDSLGFLPRMRTSAPAAGAIPGKPLARKAALQKVDLWSELLIARKVTTREDRQENYNAISFIRLR
jgi:hypothetical protein